MAAGTTLSFLLSLAALTRPLYLVINLNGDTQARDLYSPSPVPLELKESARSFKTRDPVPKKYSECKFGQPICKLLQRRESPLHGGVFVNARAWLMVTAESISHTVIYTVVIYVYTQATNFEDCPCVHFREPTRKRIRHEFTGDRHEN